MENLQRIAKAHYFAGTKRAQDLAHAFFEAMDEDGDGQVNIYEFMDFMTEEGHVGMDDPAFFKFLDRDKNGTLDFWEVMTLYYIIKSGRPFCKSCGLFLTDIYFACVECYQSPKGAFCLCLDCYRTSNSDHNHNRQPRFLDNYALLEAKRIRDMNQPRPPPMHRSQTSNAEVRYSSGQNPNYAPPCSSSSYEIVPAWTTNNNFRSWRVAFKTFETALSLANLGVGLGACSIM